LTVVIFIILNAVLLVGYKPLFGYVLACQVYDPLGYQSIDVHRVDHEDFTVLVSCLRADERLDNVANLVDSSTYSLLMDRLLFVQGNTIYVDRCHAWLWAVVSDMLLEVEISVRDAIR